MAVLILLIPKQLHCQVDPSSLLVTSKRPMGSNGCGQWVESDARDGEGLTCDNIAVKAQGRNMRNGILTRY